MEKLTFQQLSVLKNILGIELFGRAYIWLMPMQETKTKNLSGPLEYLDMDSFDAQMII